MGCNCKGTRKGITNRSQERWLVQDIFAKYQTLTGETETLTDEQNKQLKYWYYEIYPNSVEVDYTIAKRELINVFSQHKLL